jgi:hypothetical protein
MFSDYQLRTDHQPMAMRTSLRRFFTSFCLYFRRSISSIGGGDFHPPAAVSSRRVVITGNYLSSPSYLYLLSYV